MTTDERGAVKRVLELVEVLSQVRRFYMTAQSIRQVETDLRTLLRLIEKGNV